MKIKIGAVEKAKIQDGMIGLFFEDINYAADGGLYAEMLENRSFEFLKATGDFGDYQTEYDGGYGWSIYPAGAEGVKARCVSGSPHSEENPHYMRLETAQAGEGIQNKAYDGIYLKKGMEYKLVFWARCVKYTGTFDIFVEKDGARYAQTSAQASEGQEETYNYFRRYEAVLRAENSVEKAAFVLCLGEPGIVELDFVSLIPGDAVNGIFRRDLFDMLRDLKPGFLRFPGGCIVEGNTLANRYRFKDSLKPAWARKNNWNRWAVHGNHKENHYESIYSHYNQTLGLGYYEYFLLCELIGAKPLPVLNVGFACQYQSREMVSMDSPAFQEFLQDTLDLIEFANGDANTPWGAVRAEMGHPEPFGLTLLGVGNEQWQTEKADFFQRYEIFERTIHEYAPYIKLIGSAGPDVTSERYHLAWEFYHAHCKHDNNETVQNEHIQQEHVQLDQVCHDSERTGMSASEEQASVKDMPEVQNREGFVYAVDEHYYVKPQWLYDNVDFYDNYSRKVKVFSGEYAAHPVSGFNMPQANTLEGALAEAAFLTGVERNADVVALASYAPLFARLGYAQWSPDMIWFDGASCYGSPSYYAQKMYACNMGDVTLDTQGREKEAAAEGIYYSASLSRKTNEIIVKIVNSKDTEQEICLEFSGEGKQEQEICLQKNRVDALILTGGKKEMHNSIEKPEAIVPVERKFESPEKIALPALSFAVLRIKC